MPEASKSPQLSVEHDPQRLLATEMVTTQRDHYPDDSMDQLLVRIGDVAASIGLAELLYRQLGDCIPSKARH